MIMISLCRDFFFSSDLRVLNKYIKLLKKIIFFLLIVLFFFYSLLNSSTLTDILFSSDLID